MYSVLIAEDEILVRMGLTVSVPWEQLDMVVVQDVGNGQEAWEAYQRHRPDILITDLAMPGLDGLSLIRRIRQEDSHIAIVVVTCMERFDLLHQAMELGVSAYLIKVSMTIKDITQVVLKARDSLGGARGEQQVRLSPEKKKELLCAHVLTGDLSYAQFMDAAARCAWHLPREIPSVFVKLWEAGCVTEVTRRMLSHMCQEYLQPCRPVCFVKEGAQAMEIGMILEQPSSSDSVAKELENFANYVGSHFPVMPRVVVSAQPVPLERMAFWCGRASELTDQAYLFQHSVIFADSQGSVWMKELDAIMKRMRDRLFHLGPHTLAALNCLWHTGRMVGQAEQLLTEQLSALAAFVTDEPFPSLQGGLIHGFSWIEERMPPVSIRRREIVEIQRYLQEHLDTVPHLAEMAGMVHVHPQYLSSLFKQELGIGYNDYLNMLRLEKAGRMLEDESMSLQEISEQCGFSDLAYFCRKFKQKTGVTASEWRRGQR